MNGGMPMIEAALLRRVPPFAPRVPPKLAPRVAFRLWIPARAHQTLMARIHAMHARLAGAVGGTIIHAGSMTLQARFSTAVALCPS